MGINVDLVGQKFNKLEVVSVSDERRNGKKYWNCICECGNSCEVNTSELRNGHTKSCGCLIHKHQYEDLTGQRFNKLMFVKYDSTIDNRAKWLCVCDCGNEAVFNAQSVKNGNIKSCGCIRYYEDLTGQKFNKLTFVEFNYIKNYTTYWLCRCDCGKEKILGAATVKSGNTKSCGCILNQIGKFSTNWTGYKGISGTQWHRIKTMAESRKMIFDITLSDIWEKFEEQVGISGLSGTKLEFSKNSDDFNHGLITASLDRINSLNGYVIDNIWWVHKDENIIKWDLSLDNFLYFCSLTTSKDINNYKLEIQNIKRNRNWKGFGLISGGYFNNLIRWAKNRNLEFHITIDYIWDLFIKQNGCCSITNLPIFFTNRKDIKQTASLDRIDSSKGYIEGNVQWVHKTINQMKWDFDQDYFISTCSKIHNYNLGQPRI